MAEVAKDVYVRMVAKFATAEKERLLVIDENTNNILFVHVPKMQEAERKAEKTPPAVLAGYGHAAQTYWLAREGASRELATALDEFEVLAAGWFTKARQKPFTDAMGRLREGFRKLTNADKAVTKAFNALMDQFLDRAQKLADGADALAKEGKTDIDAALVVLGTLLSALSPNAKVSDKKPKIKIPVDPLAPLQPRVPEEHRAEFAERLANFSLLKEIRLGLVTQSRNDVVSRITSYPGALAPPSPENLPSALIKVTAAARKSFYKEAEALTGRSTRAIDRFARDAAAWFAEGAVREDFTTTMAALGQGFDKLTEADDKVIAAFEAIEAQLAKAAKNPDFSGGREIVKESDATANEGATQIEAHLVALRHLSGTSP